MRATVLGYALEIDGAYVDARPPEIRRQLAAYGRGERRGFDLDIERPPGFLGDVMAAMAAIPYGETRTYGELADDLDTAPIAVGQGCARNPVPVLVPCHRVVGAGGELTGYSADGGLAMKRRLLAHEADTDRP